MTSETAVQPSQSLRNVRYEIRGKLARRAQDLTRQGYEIISLNIGNPALFGFRTPESMRLAMIENFPESEGYVHQKGIFPAREAVVMQQQGRGVQGVSAEEVFIGNGVSELIDLTLRALRPILTDREVTEICINRPGEAYIETRAGWRCVPRAACRRRAAAATASRSRSTRGSRWGRVWAAEARTPRPCCSRSTACGTSGFRAKRSST